ncbi:MAG: polyprenol monophosphomannose synthase [Armatimonadota bacterium]|nr:polyprenol monophosphomannose synthase [Armatimonadota bacterium]
MVTTLPNQHRAVVVIPTYNERENLPVVCQRVLEVTGGDVHILIVDDNSPDGTGELADRLAEQHSQIHVLHREQKQGLGRAYVAGFQKALQMGYGCIAQMDADLSHNPRDLPVLIRQTAHAELVIGSRYVPGGDVTDWARWRHYLSRYANLYVRVVTGLPVADATSGYRCWRREVLEAVDLGSVRSSGYAFQIEMAYRAYRHGFRIQEIPIVFTERRAGRSKLSKRVIWEAIWLPWRLRFGRGGFPTAPSIPAQQAQEPPIASPGEHSPSKR